jgi:glycosyltransferase A (GT-A) superfamily protein (DUF2064 family)
MTADRLLIFADPPATSQVVQRLSPPLTEAAAWALIGACLRDVIARAARERGRIEIWHGGGAAGERYFGQAFGHVAQHAQHGAGAGDRQGDAFARSFEAGAERVIVLAGLAATIPDGRLTAAFEDLIEADVVVGTGTDGSPYLTGLHRRAWPRAALLFGDETWSGGVDAILAQAERADLELRLLPGWYEVASMDELARAGDDALPESHLAEWLRARGTSA